MNYFTNRQVISWISFCIGMLLLSSPIRVNANDVEASNVRFSAKVSRSAIQIADPFDLTIGLIAPAGTQVSFPEMPQLLGPFEVLETDQILDVPLATQENKNSDRRLWQRRMSLETLETGRLEIPPIEVAIKLLGGKSQIRRTKPITINVASVVEPAAELTQFQGIADVHDVELPTPTSNRWIWLASSAAAIALGLAGGAFFLAQRRNATVAVKAWALKMLEDASDLNHTESIVRQFMEERFDFPATSLPVADVLAELRAHGAKESLPAVKELLETSERAKFGGLELSGTDTSRLIGLATQVVEELDQSGGPQ